MRTYRQLTFPAALLAAVLEAQAAAPAAGSAQAAAIAHCHTRLRVVLSRDVPNPSDLGFLRSLLGGHSDYQLTLQQQELGNSYSVITLNLEGPGSEADCREAVKRMRKNAQVMSVTVQGAATRAGTTAPPGGLQLASAVQPVGTVHAGPDGDWILEPLNGTSYARLASDRYECDTWAVDRTGFDPTQDGGGVSPDAAASKRADYLRAEAACFQARGYVVR